MSEKLFTEEEIEILRKNPYVRNASERSVTYTDELKEYFVSEYSQGKMPSQILRSIGLEPRLLGKDRVDSLSRRLKKMVKREEGVRDLRKKNSGRQRTKELTLEEEIQRLKHKIKYLEQENEFLKKIEFLDKKAQMQAQLRKKNSKSSKR